MQVILQTPLRPRTWIMCCRRAVLASLLLLFSWTKGVQAQTQTSDANLLQELMRSLQVPSQPVANDAPSAAPNGLEGLGRVYAPLANPAPIPSLDIEEDGQTFTVRAPASTLGEVVSGLARTSSVDIVISGDASTPISLSMNRRGFEEILDAICMLSGHTWRWYNGTVLIAPLNETIPIDPRARGTVLRSIELSYTTAENVQSAIRDLLSPVGTVHILSSDSADHLKAREVVIIEDIESNVDRLTTFIRELDLPPRQVMIEAYVLQVDLKDEDRHGVNFDKVISWAGVPLSLEVNGFANPNASQAFLARIDGSSLDAVLEALRTQTDSRTLASPRLLVINGQEKHLQVGDQLGYRTVTTSQSGITQENVQFLDVGVILTVTPRIAPDNRVLLSVSSEVSTGVVNPQTGLPEESTSEVDTDVLLESGQGIVIGGLIQEEDTINVSGVKFLSDLKWIGPLFQRRERVKKRSEIIFVIQARVLEDPLEVMPGYECQVERASTPLFSSPCMTGPMQLRFDAEMGPCELLPREEIFSTVGHSGNSLDVRHEQPFADPRSAPMFHDPADLPPLHVPHSVPDEVSQPWETQGPSPLPMPLTLPEESQHDWAPAPQHSEEFPMGQSEMTLPWHGSDGSSALAVANCGLWSDPHDVLRATHEPINRFWGEPAQAFEASPNRLISSTPDIARLPGRIRR